MNDLINRQEAIDALKEHRALYCDNTPESFLKLSYSEKSRVDELDTAIATLVNLPSETPTLYGYQIEHLDRQEAIDAITDESIVANMDSVYDSELHRCKRAMQRILASLPSATPTLYGYPIEHLEMIARVMAKENCTPEDVVRMLQNAGEIAKMVRDEMMEMLKESVERSFKGEER